MLMLLVMGMVSMTQIPAPGAEIRVPARTGQGVMLADQGCTLC
jgi:hypothetical protein